MAQTKSGVLLQDGEQLVIELEAELWALGTTAISRAIGTIIKIISKIFGYKVKGFLVVTDRRVIEVTTTIMCYFFTVGRHVKFVMPNSIMEVGYARTATCGVCCPVYNFYYQGHTQLTNIRLKNADEAEALRICNAFYSAIGRRQ